MAQNAEDLTALTKAMENICKTSGMSINAKKTKLMVVSKDPHPIDIVLNKGRLHIEQVNNSDTVVHGRMGTKMTKLDVASSKRERPL